MQTLSDFAQGLSGPDLIGRLRAGLIGDGMAFETPFGMRRLRYADHVASGRALRQVEEFVIDAVLPFYANAHTEASACGQRATRLRDEARATVARIVEATEDCHVVFGGSGATAGLTRIVRLLDIERRVAGGERIVVLLGPYEHHSNILPWRDSGAEVVTIAEGTTGGPDMRALEDALTASEDADLVVGSFSAASNVTGLMTDTDDVTRLLKRHGALAIWDYAAAAPYLPMSMASGSDAAKDAIVFSPHKFPGGPAASGVMIVRETLVRRATPTAPGGGTVSFVSPWGEVYADNIAAREEGGTPNVVGDIRAALALLVKEAVGTDRIAARERTLRERALQRLEDEPNIQLLGLRQADAFPIFSFQVTDAAGQPVHHQLFTRMLSDVHGIQVRGGCACAGPYAHALLGIDERASAALMDRLAAGREIEKPGWVRFSLSYLQDDADAEAIVDDICRLARDSRDWAARYHVDATTARFSAVA